MNNLTVKQRVRDAVAAWSYGRRWAWTDTDPDDNRVKITTFKDGNTPLAGIESGEYGTCTCILYDENVTDDEYIQWRDGGMGLEATLSFLTNRGART